MRKIVDLYIFSNFHVALSVTSLAIVTSLNLNFIPTRHDLVFVFAATLFAYHFIRFFENFYQQKIRLHNFISTYSKRDLGIGVISFLTTLFLINTIDIQQFILLIPAGLLTFLYAIPVLPYKHKLITIRQFPRLKIFIIALVWTMVSVGFIFGKLADSWNFWVEFVQRFVFIVAITIPFDIRDYNRDDPNLKTIPQEIGMENAQKVAVLLLVVFFGLIFFKNPLTALQVLSELVVFCVSLVLIYFSDSQKSRYYTAFWVESLPILWLLVLIFTKSFIP